MGDLVTLAEVKANENILHDDDDTLLTALISRVSSIVAYYLKTADALTWDAAVAPLWAKQAALLEIGRYYRDREGVREGRLDPGNLSQAATDILWLHRDPALA